MPLQNRVTPHADIIKAQWRGDFMGNRGGRIHDPETQTLLKRKWASKRWICCVTRFKNRQRTVMSQGYTELFFLDEVSALAAGHRPCFECRREDANRFATLWDNDSKSSQRASADAMDDVLHAERISAEKKLVEDQISALPDGLMVHDEKGAAFAVRHGELLAWTGEGYMRNKAPAGQLQILTPPSIGRVLARGYEPHWHLSAKEIG